MNRLRGSVDREAARKVGKMLDKHGVDPYKPFWTGYRNATRELGLMIRINGLPLALALAIDQAGIAGDGYPPKEALKETAGRAWAVIDLARRLKPPEYAPGTPAALLALVEETTTDDRRDYFDLVETALSTLLWQKTLSAPRVPPEAKKQADAVSEGQAEGEAKEP